MKELLLTNWTLWRTARLLLGITFTVMGILRYDTFLILGGIFLIAHAIINSCAYCVGGNCSVKSISDKGD